MDFSDINQTIIFPSKAPLSEAENAEARGLLVRVWR